MQEKTFCFYANMSYLIKKINYLYVIFKKLS